MATVDCRLAHIAFELGRLIPEARFAAEVVWQVEPIRPEGPSPFPERLKICWKWIAILCDELAKCDSSLESTARDLAVAMQTFETEITGAWGASDQSPLREVTDNEFESDAAWALLNASPINSLYLGVQSTADALRDALRADERAAYLCGVELEAACLPTMTNRSREEWEEYCSTSFWRVDVQRRVNEELLDNLKGRFPFLESLTIDLSASRSHYESIRTLCDCKKRIADGLSNPATLPASGYLQLVLDAARMRVFRGEVYVDDLPDSEWKLLRSLHQAGGGVVRHEEIANALDRDRTTNAYNQAITRFKARIAPLRVTVRSISKIGYRLIDDTDVVPVI